MSLTKAVLATVAATALVFPAAASAQSATFGGAPTGVSLPMPSPMDAMRGDVPSRISACGLPYPNDNVRKVQEISEQNGMCDWYRENVGADGK